MHAVRALLAAPRAQHLEAALAEELQGLSVLGATRPLRFFPRSLLQGGRQLCHGAQREVGPQRAGLYGGAALRAGGGARRGAQQDLGAGGAEAVAAGGEHGPREELEAQRAGGLGLQLLAQRLQRPRLEFLLLKFWSMELNIPERKLRASAGFHNSHPSSLPAKPPPTAPRLRNKLHSLSTKPAKQTIYYMLTKLPGRL